MLVIGDGFYRVTSFDRASASDSAIRCLPAAFDAEPTNQLARYLNFFWIFFEYRKSVQKRSESFFSIYHALLTECMGIFASIRPFLIRRR